VPVVVINEEGYGQMTPEATIRIIDDVEQQDKVNA
jgi:NADH:ubiquinone oxidoreductase subunit E